MSILVTSLEPGAQFSEVCQTLMVNAHGCAMRSPMKLEAGVPVHFHSQEGRETTAEVVYCRPIESDRQGWMLGARFERPENFWGLKSVPKDWGRLPAPAAEKLSPKLLPGNVPAMAPNQSLSQSPAAMKTVLDRIKKQLSDENLKVVLAELVQPIGAEVTELKEKLARAGQKNRFEVSLSQIPPELEQQLELRLKNELGPQVLKQAREQSEQVLEAAKAAIDRKTTESHNDFLRQVKLDLQTVEQRTQTLSAEIAKNLREHLNRGLGELHQEVIDAGNRMKRLSEDLLKVMERSLGEEHAARRQELEQVQILVASEASRLQKQIAELDRRMAKLDESARRLESGLDQRLSRMASDAVRTARSQMESALEAALHELSTRNAQELGNQLDEASAKLKTIQTGIEASVSESLRVQVAEGLRYFEHRMEELAQQSVERWRLALAGGMNSLAGVLGEHFRLQAGSDSKAIED
ncbi:MAG TPA: hypothetical protein VK706_13545 [Candidatus Sulfotelmatobacter sp.]|nr:hypothetical protein [Candidatus Sulfotelmatobacter sp.]